MQTSHDSVCPAQAIEPPYARTEASGVLTRAFSFLSKRCWTSRWRRVSLLTGWYFLPRGWEHSIHKNTTFCSPLASGWTEQCFSTFNSYRVALTILAHFSVYVLFSSLGALQTLHCPPQPLKLQAYTHPSLISVAVIKMPWPKATFRKGKVYVTWNSRLHFIITGKPRREFTTS